ncbi:MAG: hypothetical protein CVV31_05050 [Methanomicrobiales archaeon HGW-Methanomicrobiales-2]|jgi:glycosyltransferase involved in cell wall biosynthesis|nr:MAG: hypothetical protein CVV34_00110 [Methanomicrobiales archaeon HGW-Methanomicrobiales-5]PKL62603.1 MAG: hypothetical protein CVV31_05050 [Methanomicrobiales archaeon HGW-Methanomicrobiales-2]
MPISDVFQGNDWEFRCSLAVVLTLFLAFLGSVILDTLNVPVTLFRQVIGFLFLTFVLDILLLNALQIHHVNDQKPNFGIFTFPLVGSNMVPTLHFVNIVSSLSNYTYIVTGGGDTRPIREMDRISIYAVPYTLERTSLRIIIGYVLREVRIAHSIMRLNKSVNFWFFSFGGDQYILPMLIAKLNRKKIFFVKAGSLQRNAKYSNDNLLKFTAVSSRINCFLSDKIILYSSALIQEWHMEKYRHKILIAHRHFLDFTNFTVTTPLPNRPPLIGYIGRLSGEKGIENFTQALPSILNDREELRILIGGDGQLKEAVQASLQKEGLATRVHLPGWISHDDLPKYLNQLCLLVLPSYTEGLPNIMLEAMACGTPVLATSVGAIPDIITDGRTGFIMENNSPECIAANVIRALNSPELEQVAEHGRQFVQDNFTFERVITRWKEILEEI